MKIRLLRDLPVRPAERHGAEHGMTKGRVCEVLSQAPGATPWKPPVGAWYVMGDAGRRVIVHGHEAEVVRTPRKPWPPPQRIEVVVTNEALYGSSPRGLILPRSYLPTGAWPLSDEDEEAIVKYEREMEEVDDAKRREGDGLAQEGG